MFTFMCHHSIPSIVVPLADKRKALRIFFVDYIIVLLCNISIVLMAVLNKPASEIIGLYTLNFSNHPVEALAKFLSLYPVFTLSSNFPLICITLRNNLMTVFPTKVDCCTLFSPLSPSINYKFSFLVTMHFLYK